jgi:hypothetical protein
MSPSAELAFARVFACTLLLTVAGCSGLKDYASAADRNLLIRTKTSGSPLTKVEAFLHVYRLKNACETEYLGTVKLDRDEIRTGLPQQPTYLKFVFKGSSRLGGGSSLIPYGVAVTPRPGARYLADLSYAGSVYEVTVRELGPQGKAGRLIERRALNCPPERSER